jgi:hypothetical protein
MNSSGPRALMVALACLIPLTSAAQTRYRVYAGGSIGAFSVNADAVRGKRLAAAIVTGMALKRWLDLEGEVALPADEFRRSYTGISESFAAPGSSREEIERLGVVTRFDISRHVDATWSVAAVFHPPVTSRVTPAFVAGVANHRVRDRRVYSPVAIPPGIDPDLPSIRAREESSTTNIGGPTVGASLAVAMTPHLMVEPDIRFDYGSIGDEINNTLRMSVRVLWRF